MTPDELLRLYPRATLRWLRGRLGLSLEAFAARLGASPETVAGWEALGRAIAPHHQRRILPLLARHLATPEGEAFLQSLAVAGVNGTLEDRMESRPARGQVIAKTGTTRTASALSGFVRDRYVFAVLQNGRPISTYWARRAQDRFATVLAAG